MEPGMQCVCGGRLGATGPSVRWCDKCGFHEYAATTVHDLKVSLETASIDNEHLHANVRRLTLTNSLLKAELDKAVAGIQELRAKVEQLCKELSEADLQREPK